MGPWPYVLPAEAMTLYRTFDRRSQPNISWTVESQLHRFAIEDALPFGAPNASASEIRLTPRWSLRG